MSTTLTLPTASDIAPGPANDVLYEVVRGQRVELSPMGTQEVGIANLLIRYLWQFLGDNPPGLAVMEMLFRLDSTGPLERRPDVAYVSFDRWPERVFPPVNAWAVVPTLAVEVVSRTNTAVEIEEKIDDYFKHGVQQVWVIYPSVRRIHVHDEGVNTIRVLEINDTLDGGTVLPGFRLAVSRLFEMLPQAGH